MRKLIILAIVLLATCLIACGSSGTETSIDASDISQQTINCPNWPEPTPNLYAWAYGSDPWVLVVEQDPCDGFEDYELWAVFRQYNYSNGYYNETHSWPLDKGGCWKMELAIWQMMTQPCAGQLWCDNPNACVEFKAIDKITRDVIYRAYAVPGIVNIDYPY